MLRTADEVELVKDAWEPGIRDPMRRSVHFERIIGRFLHSVKHKGSVVADMGPGHYDFGAALAKRGATVIGLELDPAVIALGRHRGLDVIEFDLRKSDLTTLGKSRWDGIFCNGSINCWWRRGRAAQDAYVQDVLAALKPKGWAYIAPCNHAPGLNAAQAKHDRDAQEAIAAQHSAFVSHGFRATSLNRLQQGLYGLSTDILPAYVFTRNLSYGRWPW